MPRFPATIWVLSTDQKWGKPPDGQNPSGLIGRLAPKFSLVWILHRCALLGGNHCAKTKSD